MATSLLSGPGSESKVVIYDTDMGADDWMAALLLLRSPQLRVNGITVTGTGLTHIEPGVRHALGLAALAGKETTPVAGGRTSPLRGTAAFPDSWRDEVDKLCGLTLPTNGHPPASTSAPDLIASLSRSAGRKIDLIASGPLTNVAEALQQDPSLVGRLGMIYIMGGAVDVAGNVHATWPEIENEAAEWNIFVDPHAAAVVLGSGVPVTLIPLDATNHAPVTVEFYERLRNRQTTPWAKFVFQVLAARIDSIRQGNYFFWDPLAAAITIDEKFTTIRETAIRIVEDKVTQLGRTEPAPTGGVPVRVCRGADRAAFEDFFLDTLNA
jgi:pyrimidine-specific ribonucleoside hydrolase